MKVDGLLSYVRAGCARSGAASGSRWRPNYLGRIPIFQYNINVLVTGVDLCLEGVDVAETALATIVVGIDRPGFEGENGVCGFVDRHRVGQVHTDEGDIDVLQGTHFGDALGVAGDVEVLAADGQDIPITAALGVHGGGAFGEVVHGDRGDADAGLGRLIAIIHNNYFGLHAIGNLVGDGLRNDDDGLAGTDSGESGGIEVIAVDVGDQDEIGLFDACIVLCTAGGVDIDGEIF